jgi:hypothetical protein
MEMRDAINEPPRLKNWHQLTTRSGHTHSGQLIFRAKNFKQTFVNHQLAFGPATVNISLRRECMLWNILDQEVVFFKNLFGLQ